MAKKLEFATQLLVDMALTKANRIVAKMFVKIAAFGELSGAIGEGVNTILSRGEDIKGDGAVAIKGSILLEKLLRISEPLLLTGFHPHLLLLLLIPIHCLMFEASNRNGNDSKYLLSNDKTQERFIKEKIDSSLRIKTQEGLHKNGGI